MQQEALARAISGPSVGRGPAPAAGFVAEGVPGADIRPRANGPPGPRPAGPGPATTVTHSSTGASNATSDLFVSGTSAVLNQGLIRNTGSGS